MSKTLKCTNCGALLDDFRGTVCPFCRTTIPIDVSCERERNDVVSYNGNQNYLMKRHEREDFPAGTEIMVQSTQEAVYLRNGQVAGTMTPGLYRVDSTGYPIPEGLEGDAETGAVRCRTQICFFNMQVQRDIKWGTATKPILQDAPTGIRIPVGAYGQVTVRVGDVSQLYSKLVGETDYLDWETFWNRNSGQMLEHFRLLIQARIGQVLAEGMPRRGIGILHLDEYRKVIGEDLKESLWKDFEEYGLILPEVIIGGFRFPEGNDPDAENMKRLR